MAVLVLGPSNVSQAIAREQFYCRFSDNIFHKLSQAKMFAIVNFSNGYYPIKFVEAVHSWPTLVDYSEGLDSDLD